MTLSTGEGYMCTRQWILHQAMIKRRRMPCLCRMALRAVLGQVQSLVIRIRSRPISDFVT